MLKWESLFQFLESNFDYLLVVEGERKVVRVNDKLAADCRVDASHFLDHELKELLTEESCATFRSAMKQAASGARGIAALTLEHTPRAPSIALKVGYIPSDTGGFYLCFGNRVSSQDIREEWQKDERIKELSCLYDVAELIEATKSIDEFFTLLPGSLSKGMINPEEVVVYSVYQGVEYGARPTSDKYISTRLVVGGQEKGEIRVGYFNDNHELLPEEQKMLDEIGRMLNTALERKEFQQRLVLKQEEEKEYNRRLEKLQEEIAERTRQIEEQKNSLGVMNSYLDRVKGGWEEAKHRLETMFAAIPDEVVLIDKQLRVIMTNREDVEPGDYCYRAFFCLDAPCEDCRFERIMREKTPFTITHKVEDRYLQIHTIPVYNQQDEVDGILEFFRDVTLEKTYDQQLQQADKLASLGQLVSGIGHEINNPNQFIRGNIKIIKQALEDMLPIVDDYFREHPDLKIARLDYRFFREHIMTLVDDMAHGSERIKGIVDDLRTFVRKDEGLLVDNVDINTLAASCARLVEKEVHKRADIKLELGEDIPAFVGNAQKIEQVLINLIVNARDAMRDDEMGLIILRTRREDNQVVIEVEDNGKGMSQQVLKKIFDPFFTTKRARGGTGLGLAITYRIIQEHGGNISVTSKPGVGTTFRITIPLRSVPAVSGEEK